jgi:hypothetical protein
MKDIWVKIKEVTSVILLLASFATVFAIAAITLGG